MCLQEAQDRRRRVQCRSFWERSSACPRLSCVLGAGEIGLARPTAVAEPAGPEAIKSPWLQPTLTLTALRRNVDAPGHSAACSRGYGTVLGGVCCTPSRWAWHSLPPSLGSVPPWCMGAVLPVGMAGWAPGVLLRASPHSASGRAQQPHLGAWVAELGRAGWGEFLGCMAPTLSCDSAWRVLEALPSGRLVWSLAGAERSQPGLQTGVGISPTPAPTKRGGQWL